MIGFSKTWVKGLAPFRTPTAKGLTTTSLVAFCNKVELRSSDISFFSLSNIICFKMSGSTGSVNKQNR